MKYKFFIFPVIALFLIVACATTIDSKVGYLTTRDSFNGALASYSARVKAMPQGVEKDLIKAEFNPFWKDAASALDTWGDIVKGVSSDDPTEAIRLFTNAKNRLIELGLKYFGDKLFSE